MSPSEYLDSVETDDNAVLYECRRNQDTAEKVIPRLIEILREPHPLLLIRALNALYRIGHPSEEATPEVVRLVFHSDTIVARAAILTSTVVGRNAPDEVVRALVAVSAQPELIRDVMHSLIPLGLKAHIATGVFESALSHADHRVRRLAIRGLEAISDKATLSQALDKAVSDRSKSVRDYAQKVQTRRNAEQTSGDNR